MKNEGAALKDGTVMHFRVERSVYARIAKLAKQEERTVAAAARRLLKAALDSYEAAGR